MFSSISEPAILIILLGHFITQISSNNFNVKSDQGGCDYAHCPAIEDEKLNIHLIPHSHDDVGWLKTVDQYYYGSAKGSATETDASGVQYILDSVVKALIAGEGRRFIYVETAFFWKWWKEQRNFTKTIVKDLVKTGQLEFISGGWSMNDEATTHYNSIIDQMTWGFRRLGDAFGVCGVPKIGWQIDPFGHSREMASLFAQMNFDSLFFARFDYQEKQIRETNKTLELVWSGSDDLGSEANLFTSLMDKHYDAPQGFCFDIERCNDDPFIDDPKSPDYNVEKKLDMFEKWIADLAPLYHTNNILIPMGTDFNYQNAHIWFKQMDKLIKYMKERRQSSNLNIFYSTPSCYTHAVWKKNLTYTAKTDDFFPLGSDPVNYWTGFFSSRPTLKYYERVGNNFLQVCKQLASMSLPSEDADEKVADLREAMGVLQHHDAIAGTEKEAVAADYARILYEGMASCESVVSSSLNQMIAGQTQLKQVFCRDLNISACDVTESVKDESSVAVIIYNPIGRLVSQYFRLPVVDENVELREGSYGKIINTETISIPDYVQNIPGRKSNAKFEMLFKADTLPLGFKTYFISRKSTNVPSKKEKHTQKSQILLNKNTPSNVEIKAKSFTVIYNEETHLLAGIILNSGQEIKLTQSLEYYLSTERSNNYIFEPKGTSSFKFSNISGTIVKGEFVTEIRQVFSDWAQQTVRIYPDEDYIEFDWLVGHIPMNDKIGREVTSRFYSDLATDKTFYTDANGRQMLKRVKDERSTWKYKVTEPVSSNYYPVTSRIALRDEKKGIQLTVLNDRAQGGTSMNDGQLELMVHRRLPQGGITLNETGVDGKGLMARGKHYLIPSSITDAAKLHRDLAQRLFMAPSITFVGDVDWQKYKSQYKTHFAGLKEDLPPNVHLLTLEQWKDGEYLVRLEHFYATNEDPNGLSKPASVALANLFTSFKIVNVKEMILGGNQLKGEREKLHFKTNQSFKNIKASNPVKLDSNFTVTLNPMQIRSFLVKVQR